MYCMGEEAEEMLMSTDLLNEDRKEYKKVRKNPTFEHALFCQGEEEQVEQFITDLYRLSESCDWGNH